MQTAPNTHVHACDCPSRTDTTDDSGVVPVRCRCYCCCSPFGKSPQSFVGWVVGQPPFGLCSSPHTAHVHRDHVTTAAQAFGVGFWQLLRVWLKASRSKQARCSQTLTLLRWSALRAPGRCRAAAGCLTATPRSNCCCVP